MRFKKFGNFKHLVYAVILSFILSYIFLIIGIDIKVSYLLSNGILMIFYIILSILYRNEVLKCHNVQGVIKDCKYRYLSHCDLTYEFSYNGKTRNVIYSFSGVEPVGKIETLYITDDEKIIREREITLFKNKGLTIFLLVAVLFMFIGIKEFNVSNVELNLAGENFGKIFLFKFFNVFLIFFIITLVAIYNKLKLKGIVVQGKIIDYRTHVNSEMRSKHNLERKITMYSCVFEYIWNGEKREYISPISSSSVHKIGSTRKLYVDQNGLVIKEQGEIRTLILFGLVSLMFYLIGIFGVFHG